MRTFFPPAARAPPGSPAREGVHRTTPSGGDVPNAGGGILAPPARSRKGLPPRAPRGELPRESVRVVREVGPASRAGHEPHAPLGSRGLLLAQTLRRRTRLASASSGRARLPMADILPHEDVTPDEVA